MSTVWQRIARAQAGDDYATVYADRFRAIAAGGGDVHGEAALVAELLAPPASVLDAGCGTGRVGARLHELGYDVVGCDVDAAMVAVARDEVPDVEWHVADLAGLALGRRFDLVLLAGNVLPLLEPGTLTAAARSLADHVAPGGALVTGFGLDAAHLPGDCPVLALADVDAAFAAVGLEPTAHWAGWDRAPYDDGGYVVASYRPRGDTPSPPPTAGG
ncbi:class I SAM-dependent methyltransferase [Nocardioides alkalitolerans]|uniref:class I SAM-dependent methyltransferase n=1 Tax=Nocardioides alkalitolerans TaxID=281714 RepID=UPI000402DB69|nr:class I SAM-dependent methyltransferase [Nocardioides alkalitolerans]